MNSSDRIPHEIDLLDSYFDELVLGSKAKIPAGIDTSSGEIARGLMEVMPVTIEMSSEDLHAAKSRVWQQVLYNTEMAQVPPPLYAYGKEPVWARLARLWQSNMSVRMSFALGVVVVAVVLLTASITFLNSTPTVSAAEILSRAADVANNPGALGLHSYKAVVEGENPAGAFYANYTYNVWYKAPNKTRTEVELTAMDGTPIAQITPASQLSGKFIMTDDGTEAWFHPADNTTANLGVTGVLSFGAPAYGAVDLESLLSNASASFDVSLAGIEKVIGRDTYKLEMTPKPDTQHAPYLAHVTSWIDKETYVALRYETRDATGTQFLLWRYVSFELNPDLSDSLFSYTPGPNTQVTWQAIPTKSEQLRMWGQLTHEVPYTLYMPDYAHIPARFISQAPVRESTSVTEWYNSDSNPFALSLRELASSPLTYPPSDAKNMQPIQIADGLKGFYSGGSSNSLLIFNRDGTTIEIESRIDSMENELQSSLATKDELISIAASLAPVPTEEFATFTPNPDKK